MKKYDSSHIEYKGETNGVHSWIAPSGQPYYWHPDWLHIAEDAMGSHPKQKVDVSTGDKANKNHAIAAILSHINQWASDKLAQHPEIESEAIEYQIDLKK
ncbi:hypothetical protein [Vibrio salilacus]|uniref:hypothetical protein n=1 Tax=Vibrio salilacus TaxID=1323749 RepID=UPI000C2A27B0|nr:hypothetical protein [Vibrio salilacus]